MSARGHSRALRFALLAIPVLFVTIGFLQIRIQGETRTVGQQKEELLLRSGLTLKRLSLGYDSLLGDIYWTRAVQYYGSRVGNHGEKFELLWPLLDITTTLDPNLIVAYRFGAIFLSEPMPTGADRSDLAVELVKKGVAANPNSWELSSDLGFLYYWHLKDYEKASAAYLQGSKIPNAPSWMKMMAAQVAEKGNAFSNSLAIWSELYETTQNEKVKKNAFQHLQSLHALQDTFELNKLAEQYRKQYGTYPASMKELYERGLLQGVPLDPAGFPYSFGADGKAQLEPNSPITLPKISESPTP
jgi:tetratricopeptide (TPR) repeat protein